MGEFNLTFVEEKNEYVLSGMTLSRRNERVIVKIGKRIGRAVLPTYVTVHWTGGTVWLNTKRPTVPGKAGNCLLLFCLMNKFSPWDFFPFLKLATISPNAVSVCLLINIDNQLDEIRFGCEEKRTLPKKRLIEFVQLLLRKSRFTPTPLSLCYNKSENFSLIVKSCKIFLVIS